MHNLYTLVMKANPKDSTLDTEEEFSVRYHDIFDYPLSFSELIRWRVSGKQIISTNNSKKTICTNGCFHLEDKNGLFYKKQMRKRISAKKLVIAKKAAAILSKLPSIQMVGVTGSLAMENSSQDSDIDLMIVCQKNLLWTTRFLVYCLLHATGYLLRKPRVKYERDALCLNMWLDESDLIWDKKDRNLYTAHEIAQIVPLVNKNKTYEKFLAVNEWILDFWPNSVRISSKQKVGSSMRKQKSLLHDTYYMLLIIVERFAFWIQYKHMESKITREFISPTRAIFHPNDWGKIVMSRFSS